MDLAEALTHAKLFVRHEQDPRRTTQEYVEIVQALAEAVESQAAEIAEWKKQLSDGLRAIGINVSICGGNGDFPPSDLPGLLEDIKHVLTSKQDAENAELKTALRYYSAEFRYDMEDAPEGSRSSCVIRRDRGRVARETLGLSSCLDSGTTSDTSDLGPMAEGMSLCPQKPATAEDT